MVNYLPVHQGKIVIPRVGRAVAELSLKSNQPNLKIQEGQSVSLDIEFGPEFSMHIFSLSQHGGDWKLKCVGGTGGLSRIIPAKQYRNAKVEEIIRDLLTEVGEKVAGDWPKEVLLQWGRQAGIACRALESLMVNIDKTWRMTPSGEVWVGEEMWPPYEEMVRLTRQSSSPAKWVLHTLEPNLRPGVELFGYRGEFQTRVGRVERVVHHFEDRAWTEVHCW